MDNSSIGTPEQLRDPNYTPPIFKAVPLGIQHVLAMFVSNVTPAIIVAGAAGFDAFSGPAEALERLSKEKRAGEIEGAIRELRELAERIVVAGPEGARAGPPLGRLHVVVVLQIVADDQRGPVGPVATAAEPLPGAEGLDGDAVCQHDRAGPPDGALSRGAGVIGGQARIVH